MVLYMYHIHIECCVQILILPGVYLFILKLKKINVDSGETLTWFEKDCYPSEPVFVPHPEGVSEDHG